MTPTLRRKTAGTKKLRVGWRSRILGYGEEQAGQLMANPANWRIHPKLQTDAMRSLLGHELGWLQNVIVNKRISEDWPAGERHVETVIDGHMRIQLALREGDESLVPCTYVDLTPKEEALALASFDRVSALAETDDAQYDALLAGLADVSADVSAILVREPRKQSEPKPKTACACCQKKCHPDCKCYTAGEN